MDITVFSSGPSCQRCRLSEKRLDNLGLPYTEVRVDRNEEVADVLRRNGFKAMPVIHAFTEDDDVIIEDFRPDSLDALKALYAPVSSEGMEMPVAA